MNCNNLFGGNCSWILIVVLLLVCCGGNDKIADNCGNNSCC